MAALKSKNPLTESFLVQLEVDLEGSGLDIRIPPSNFTNSLAKEMSLNMDSVKCSPLFEISQSQAAGYNGMRADSSPTQTRQPTAPSNSEFLNQNAYTAMPNLPQRNKQSLHNVDLFNNSTDWNEMDTSPDGSGATRMSSGLPTPSSASHKASSNTSFSPQAQNLGVSPVNFSDSNSPNTQQPTNFNNFNNNTASTNDQNSVFSSGNQIFPMPSSWDFPNHSAANPSPANRTGLTPQPHPENLHASPQRSGHGLQQQQQYGTRADGGLVNENGGTPWNELNWDGVQNLADMGMGLGDLGGLGGLGPGLGSTNWDGSGGGVFGMGSAEWNAHLNSG